jgi:hypothetical protein
MWVGPALGDQVTVPAQQSLWLDEEVPKTLAREKSCQSDQDRSVGRLKRRSDLASEDCHLVAQHHDLDGEVHVPATGEPDQLEDAAERPVEE